MSGQLWVAGIASHGSSLCCSRNRPQLFMVVILVLLGSIPRYVRINRIKTTLKDVIQSFKQNGYQLVEQQNIASFVRQVNIPLMFHR